MTAANAVKLRSNCYLFNMSQKSESIKHILSSIFSAENALRSIAPEFNWRNVVGDYGELVAIEHYGLKKAEHGSSGYDTFDINGKTVEIKTNYFSKTFGIRGEADLLLVIKVKVDGTWEELYYGDFKKVLSIANYSARDNKHSISITALKKFKV